MVRVVVLNLNSNDFRFSDWSLEREELDGSFLAPTQKPKPNDDLNENELVFDVNAAADYDDDDGGIGADFVGADDFCDNDDGGNRDVVFDDKREEFRGGMIGKGKNAAWGQSKKPFTTIITSQVVMFARKISLY